jgi:heme-degrading monooxygenase HmoA
LINKRIAKGLKTENFTPYYAVIFTSKLANTAGYAQMALKMEELAQQQAGFMGMDSAREDVGITVSYWKDVESIQAWKKNVDHLNAQELGKTKWYESYSVRIAKVEREYNFK